MTLTGVAVRASGGCALVIVQGHPGSVFCSGEELSPGVRVDTVQRDRIVIVRNGAREAVFMKDVEGTTAGVTAPALPIVQSTGPDRQLVDRRQLQQQMGRPEFLNQALIVPNPDGGFLVRQVQAGSLYEKLGLRPGDVIRNVNGQPLTSMDDVSRLYQQFLSALKAQGFTAVEGPGDAVRIIPVAEAKAAAPVSDQEGPPRGGEQIITHVVIGQHVAVAQLQNVLRPLMSPTSQLSVYDPANALIITDYADNVRRLLRIIERIDLPASTDVTVIPVQHASAIDLAELVVRLSGTGVATPGTLPGAAPGQIAAGGGRLSVGPGGGHNSKHVRPDT